MTVSIATPPKARPWKKGKRVPFEQSKCGGCVALCCRYFALEIDAPTKPSDFEDMRWFILHDKVEIFTEGRSWYVQVFNRCRWLGEDNLCTNYDKRPEICRTYENDWCDRDELEGSTGGNDKAFRTLEELEAYRDVWVKRWEAKRRKARQAAARRAARTRKRNARKASDTPARAKNKKKKRG